ncbi:integrase [Paenibacillus terrae]|uniref:Integrase n=1 Tax=Paenibacillus terrae TaxID=159743 RepID=A0A0D7WU69_9BACL|nr:integrase [Paenibacillus terrae]
MAIANVYISQGHSISLVLRILEVERSTYYAYVNRRNKPSASILKSGRPTPGYSFTQEGKRISDEQIKEWLMEMLADEYTSVYGYRKLTKLLNRQHRLVINKKKVYRLCKQMRVLRPQRKIKVKHPKRLANNRTLTGSNQLWETDIKYGWIAGEQRFFFLLSIIDVFDRSIVTYHLGLSCEAKDVVQITQEALMKRQLFDRAKRPVIRSDNGPQFISHRFAEACEQFELIHERIPPKTPNKNAHIESFHAILESECYQRHEFESYPHAYEVVTGFIHNYNHDRLHGSIYDMSPYEYMTAIKQGTVEAKLIKV